MPEQSRASQGALAKPATKMCVCVHCHSNIPLRAPRCVKCGGYQNWRRHLNFSGVVLSLLVALFSVAGLTVPAIVDAIRGTRSILQVEPSFVTDQIAYFHFSNKGGAPGLIESLRFVVDTYEIEFDIDQLDQDGDERLLRANYSGVLHAKARQLVANGFSIRMGFSEAEAYMDELHQWSWSLDEPGAYEWFMKKYSDAIANVPIGGLGGTVTEDDQYGLYGLRTVVRLALHRAQSHFREIDKDLIQHLNYDDMYDPKGYRDIAYMLTEHEESLIYDGNRESVEFYLEVNTILEFLDAVFAESDTYFLVALRNSDGSAVSIKIPVDYLGLRRFLRPALLDDASATASWLAFFL